MRARFIPVGVACLVLLGAGAAAAQEPAKIGITMGYPSSIGVVWRASERVAIRPELSVSFGSSSTSAQPLRPISSGSDSWLLGTGVSVLFYLRKSDNLSTYLSPRFSYLRSSLDTGFSETASDGYSLAGMFGAEYALGRRFSVFGEVGTGYTGQKSESASLGAFTTRSHTVGTRSGAGVILYF